MCGIAGTLGRAPDGMDPIAIAQRMLATLVHRGPDDAALWLDPQRHACLGARRLSIVDPTPAGRQPMTSRCGRYVVALNGELYNHRALRAAVDGIGDPSWRGTSDTEALVAAIAAWGVGEALRRAVGMFAVAVWDRADDALLLARDRIGEKPLHYARCDEQWVFGSELKALVAHPRFDRTVDRRALASYLALGYVSAPATIYAAARKVMPGCIVRLRARDPVPRTTRYWCAATALRAARGSRPTDAEAVGRLETLLSDAVGDQMLADRPVGALLSGGVDSSSVVALMAARRTGAIDTFSIGFRQRHFDEAHFAARVARHFGTRHTELYVGADDVRDAIAALPRIYDEPFADISQIPTYLVSRLASASVAVALTGDGGDELFGGYPRYRLAARLSPTVERTPPWLRAPLGRIVDAAPDAVDRAFAWAMPHDEVSGRRGLRPVQKLRKLAHALSSADRQTLYWRLLAPWSDARLARPTPEGPAPAAADASPRFDSVEEDFMFRDLVGYLPDDILAKIDRASMAVGVESRAPLLDHRVVEFALGLPYAMKFRDGTSKWLLRQVLYRHVPQDLVDRPKMGFEMPIASWLRGPLKDWAYALVASSAAAGDLVDLALVRALLDRHASGVGDGHQPLWTALMLLGWAQAARPDAEPRGPRDDAVVETSAAWRPQHAAA